MAQQEKKLAGKDILQTLVPLNALSAEFLDKLSKTTFVYYLPKNQKLFKKGQKDGDRYYLIRGIVVLEGGDKGPVIVKGGSEDARYPLDHHQPRTTTAVAKSDIAYVRINDERLDRYLTMDQSAGGYSVDEMAAEEGGSDEDSDWMTRVLQSKSFSDVPATNIQAMFMRLESVAVRKDEEVVRQGDAADHYYIVNRGNCEVVVKDDAGKEKVVARLGAGDSFGEEALVSKTTRNATVRMTTPGVVMRLSRNDFEELLKEPLLRQVSLEEAREMLKDGSVLLDVRLESEFQKNALRGSKNVPLRILRNVVPKLSADRKYIVCCDTGQRSCSAGYILRERGFDVYVLEGGLKAVAESRNRGESEG